jgi:hypothetical protein
LSDEIKQGTLANISGNALEQIVVSTLILKGFTLVNYGDYAKSPLSFAHELLIRNAPYLTIYGHPGKTEFLVLSEKYGLEMRIECKWQQSPGSVDEKFPYLYLNCVEAMPERQIMIIVDGGGAKAGAIRWLKTTSQSRKYLTDFEAAKQIQVVSLTEFVAWAHKTLR